MFHEAFPRESSRFKSEGNSQRSRLSPDIYSNWLHSNPISADRLIRSSRKSLVFSLSTAHMLTLFERSAQLVRHLKSRR